KRAERELCGTVDRLHRVDHAPAIRRIRGLVAAVVVWRRGGQDGVGDVGGGHPWKRLPHLRYHPAHDGRRSRSAVGDTPRETADARELDLAGRADAPLRGDAAGIGRRVRALVEPAGLPLLSMAMSTTASQFGWKLGTQSGKPA